MDFRAGPPPQPLYPMCIGSQARTKTAQLNFDISITVQWPTDVPMDGLDQQNENSAGTQCLRDRMRSVQDQMAEIERRCVRSIAIDADYCFIVSRRTPAADVLDIRIACCLRESVSARGMDTKLRDGIILPTMTQGLHADAKHAFKVKMQDLRHINISTRLLESHHLFESHKAAAISDGENDGHQVQVLLSRYPRQLVGRRIATSESCERSRPSATADCRAFEIKITFRLSDDSDLQGALKSIQDVLTRSTNNCFIVSEACSPLASVVCACTYSKATTQRSLQKQKFQSIRAKLDEFSVLSPCVSVGAMTDHTLWDAFREPLPGATILYCR